MRLERSRIGLLALTLILLVALAHGCERTAKTTSRSVLFDQPAISGGVFVEEEDPVRLRELANALDAIEINAGERAADTAFDPAALDVTEPLAIGVASASVADMQLPADATRLIALPKMSDLEIVELISLITLKLGTDHGYDDAGTYLEQMLPRVPEGVVSDRVLATGETGETGAGAIRVMRLGHRRFVSQPPQLWVMGVTIGENEEVSPNADADVISDMVAGSLAALEQFRGTLTVHDLESKLIQLSYTDAATAVKLLTAMGISAYDDSAAVPADIDHNQLPYVVAIPDPAATHTGLVGDADSGGGQNKFGLSLTPNIPSQLPESTIASPMTQLLVMFHPAQPEQFSRVRTLLDERIDRPARQIFVEGLVLEISEQGLKDLGIEWELDGGALVINGGKLIAGAPGDTLGISFDDFLNPGSFNWSGAAELRALIREGKAEVLSRPSVLTLNNRQATIRVGTDIPIATSQEGLGASSNKLVFDFKYLATGILLNIRPRINEIGSEVSMLIDTIVSDTVRGQDLDIRSTDGQLLASAPTVSTRRVQTYARIRNNTPFIIGGLVARENTSVTDKVPLLGDLPIVGPLFRAQRDESEKREVIIVLTPHVLPEHRTQLTSSLPKDEDAFDSFGNELFRDSYRIRTEDVFDLAFLRDNRRLNAYRELARLAIQRNFRLEDIEPFSSFAGNRIPGEGMLVIRMIYEVVKRLNLSDAIEMPSVIYLEEEQFAGYQVRFLDDALGRVGGGEGYAAFLAAHPGKAMALTYTIDRESVQPGTLNGEPIPTLSIVDCPDRESWGKLLWELNQPLPDGSKRNTILLNDEADFLRLKRAIVLKRIVALNGGEAGLSFDNFAVGRTFLMPELKQEQIHIADADVARLFFLTEHYYAALLERMERSLTALDAAVRDPGLGMPDLAQKLDEVRKAGRE